MEENTINRDLAINQSKQDNLSATFKSKTENGSNAKIDLGPAFTREISENSLEFKRSGSNLKSIHLAGERFIIKDEAPMRSYETYKLIDSPQFPGVYFQGIQYYDLKNVFFINNTGMANLIDLLKSLLQKDVEVQFVNVSDKIKNKIKALGLDHIIICS
jgi:ABC-type transporter Mla MlaB component